VRVINRFFKFDFKFRALLDLRVIIRMRIGWPPFGHESIEHEPLTALESEKHRSLWLVVSN